MKITDYRHSTIGVILGTAANANAITGVSGSSNATAKPGTVIVAISSNMFEWRDALSFGSNANDVGTASTMGASASNTRADHVHRGISAVAVSSNTLYGPVTLVAGSGMQVAASGQSVMFTSTPTGVSAVSHPSAASNSYSSGVVLTNDATIALTSPVSGTFNFSAPFFSEVVTDSNEIVWHGSDVVHDLVRLY